MIEEHFIYDTLYAFDRQWWVFFFEPEKHGVIVKKEANCHWLGLFVFLGCFFVEFTVTYSLKWGV